MQHMRLTWSGGLHPLCPALSHVLVQFHHLLNILMRRREKHSQLPERLQLLPCLQVSTETRRKGTVLLQYRRAGLGKVPGLKITKTEALIPPEPGASSRTSRTGFGISTPCP